MFRGSTPIAISYLLAYLVLRVGLTWITGSWGLGDRKLWQILWLVPVRDALSFVIWIIGFFSDEITWRGLGYRVQKGRLYQILSTSRTPGASVGIGFLSNRMSDNRQNLPRT